MTFLQFAESKQAGVRILNGISKYRITEYTPYQHLIMCGGIGRHSAMDIEQLQQDYIKTFDVAYQQVIQYVRSDARY